MLEQLFADLNCREERTRADAQRRLQTLSADNLLALAKREVAWNSQRRRKIVLTHGAVGLALLAAWGIGLQTRHFTLASFLEILSIVVFGSAAMRYYQVTPVRHALTDLLDKINDPRALRIALTLYPQDRRDYGMRRSVCAAMKRLLPRLHANQIAAFTKEERRALLVPLEIPYAEPELTLCVLKALEQVGDESAIPLVAFLANDGAPTPRMKRIRQAARECLPYLHQNIAQAKQAQTLLRAADASSALPEILLRPATTTDDHAPKELLRPQQVERR